MLVLQGRLQGRRVAADQRRVVRRRRRLAAARQGAGRAVIGTSGSRRQAGALKPLGLDVACAPASADFAPAVMEATGGAWAPTW
jgi:hypothetical protein